MPPIAEPPPVEAGKAVWRRWLRARRAPVPGEVNERIGARLIEWLGARPGAVCAYDALVGEVDLGPLIEADPDRFVLPRLDADGHLVWHPATAPRRRHRLGFAEPVPEAPVVSARELAAVLVPCELVDRRGFRLGHGGGHYDRFLGGLASRVPRVAVVAARGLVDEVPTEAHDQRCDVIVTESALIRSR